MDLLECDAEPSEVGGAGEGVAAEAAGGSTPEQALENFLTSTFFSVPSNGYAPIAQSGDRYAYGYEVDGKVKVVLVISPRFAELVRGRFAAEELRTCPQSEFGSQAVFNDGRRVWTHETTGEVLTDNVGPQHCGYESARMLITGADDATTARMYVRDPNGVFGGWSLLESYAERVEMPDDAAFSGYRSPEGFELWLTGGDRAAYVVTPEGVERWPRAEELIGCM